MHESSKLSPAPVSKVKDNWFIFYFPLTNRPYVAEAPIISYHEFLSMALQYENVVDPTSLGNKP